MSIDILLLGWMQFMGSFITPLIFKMCIDLMAPLAGRMKMTVIS